MPPLPSTAFFFLQLTDRVPFPSAQPQHPVFFFIIHFFFNSFSLISESTCLSAYRIYVVSLLNNLKSTTCFCLNLVTFLSTDKRFKKKPYISNGSPICQKHNHFYFKTSTKSWHLRMMQCKYLQNQMTLFDLFLFLWNVWILGWLFFIYTSWL